MKIHLLFLVICAVVPTTSFARVANFSQILSENQQELNLNHKTLKNSLNESPTEMKTTEVRKRVVLHEKSEVEPNPAMVAQN